jgi:hypothetical protein
MNELLIEVSPLFQYLAGLSLPQSWCHRIHLVPGTTPITVWPYRYAHAQKTELERQCTDMLCQGVIRYNCSSFSTPVLLVQKSDDSWHFCVDYRALNAKTVKDKFRIPIVKELFDELCHTKFFTKLDLHLGYHQVRMRPDDVEKTVFRTHQGLFEFGLTNAPATFQALMNEVLRPFMCLFILVFFDDILIYSPSWMEHFRYVWLVLAALQQHKLFLKCAKCAFWHQEVAYLGHVISVVGVAMDE